MIAAPVWLVLIGLLCVPNLNASAGTLVALNPSSLSQNAYFRSISALSNRTGQKCDTNKQAEYCSISNVNTMCKYCDIGKKCGEVLDRGMTQAEKDLILKLHNDMRSKVAKGEEGSQPKATNMNALKWNDELAVVAQMWTDQCSFGHDINRGTKLYAQAGQNVAEERSTKELPKNLTIPIQKWYDEVQFFPPEGVPDFTRVKEPSGKSVKHYTQIVWAETKEIGCGFISYLSSGLYRQYLICNYGPQGNILGEALYQTGPTASSCQHGTEDGLCLWSDLPKGIITTATPKVTAPSSAPQKTPLPSKTHPTMTSPASNKPLLVTTPSSAPQKTPLPNPNILSSASNTILTLEQQQKILQDIGNSTQILLNSNSTQMKKLSQQQKILQDINNSTQILLNSNLNQMNQPPQQGQKPVPPPKQPPQQGQKPVPPPKQPPKQGQKPGPPPGSNPLSKIINEIFG